MTDLPYYPRPMEPVLESRRYDPGFMRDWLEGYVRLYRPFSEPRSYLRRGAERRVEAILNQVDERGRRK